MRPTRRLRGNAAPAAAGKGWRLVDDRLRGFAAVGTLEELEASLALFADSAGCADASPLLRARTHTQHASFKRQAPPLPSRLDAELEACRPQAEHAMRVDAAIYAEARRIMAAQLGSAGPAAIDAAAVEEGRRRRRLFWWW